MKHEHTHKLHNGPRVRRHTYDRRGDRVLLPPLQGALFTDGSAHVSVWNLLPMRRVRHARLLDES